MTLPQRLKSILCLVIACFSPSIGNQAISLSEHVKRPSEADIKCLAANLFFEARGEGVKGMELVADVTINRMIDRKLSACRVIMQPKQFSWWARVLMIEDIQGDARRIAAMKLTNHLNGVREDLTDGALYYHNTGVKPSWARKMKRLFQYRNHIFYGGMK